jgi:hypothetical protein
VQPLNTKRSDHTRSKPYGGLRENAQVWEKAFARLKVKAHSVLDPCQIFDTRLHGVWARAKVKPRAPNSS